MLIREIVEETAGAFTLDTRATDDEGYCTYYPKLCAVGRCLENPELFEDSNSCATDLGDGNLEQLLKPEYRGHSAKFWNRLQLLHDIARYWDSDGLSELGRSLADKIVADFEV